MRFGDNLLYSTYLGVFVFGLPERLGVEEKGGWMRRRCSGRARGPAGRNGGRPADRYRKRVLWSRLFVGTGDLSEP